MAIWTTCLRLFALWSLALWIGGFMFYSAVVIPVLHDQLGSPMKTGLVTQRGPSAEPAQSCNDRAGLASDRRRMALGRSRPDRLERGGPLAGPHLAVSGYPGSSSPVARRPSSQQGDGRVLPTPPDLPLGQHPPAAGQHDFPVALGRFWKPLLVRESRRKFSSFLPIAHPLNSLRNRFKPGNGQGRSKGCHGFSGGASGGSTGQLYRLAWW
jgi:hypothetical protein